ncbi:uncharacterized protein LOC126800381 [Argentina anserina]|uniref:uncharacterized protein LOC126800381 n=1 Tax=Argentina anserina TaxID=57926 RepID=UPI0021764F3F|nr:uncharacterized protein LOC126800381 [Potentilla anserina]
MLAQLSSSVVSRLLSTLLVEEAIYPARNSGTAPCRKVCEVDDVDDDGFTEFFDAFDEESPEPKFVFKFEYQTSEILKTLEKYDQVGHYVALQAQSNSTRQNGSAEKSNCECVEAANVDEMKISLDSDEAKCGSIEGLDRVVGEGDVHVEKGGEGFGDGAFEEEGVEKKIVIEEVVDVSNEVNVGSIVNEVSNVTEEVSHSDEMSGDETVATSDEDELVSEEEFVGSEFSSGSICSSHDDDDDDDDDEELVSLEEIGLNKPDGFDEEDSDILEQYRELEELCRAEEQNSTRSKLQGEEKLVHDHNGSDDSDTMEVLWEHQELIDQSKVELKRVRATGLPTIFEESEYVNMDDLKPLKIHEKYQHAVPPSEQYRALMREFDKKITVIGVLQSKGSLKLLLSHKSSTPAIKSFLSNLRLCRPKIDCDPIVKIIKEVQSQLEMVYVGQLCLSWEFLEWQYEKALELLKSAPDRIHSYNEVAEEFQQFQVLLQRFIEDEQFQGSRVENYVKSRSAMHKFLQVPEIREDKCKEGKKGSEITTDIVEMLRESVRTMWRFIRADKNANITTACRKRSLDDCLDPNLFVEVQADLGEKQRMLKELKRSQNPILKRFQKHEEEKEEEESADDGHLNFFSEVNIRLVSRVLNMSTIKQHQLEWCQRKLSKIHCVKRKVHM